MQSQILFSEMKNDPFRTFNTYSSKNIQSNIHYSNLLAQSKKPEENLRASQEKICQFFLDIVKRLSPETVLTEFDKLFLNPSSTSSSEQQKALHSIILSETEQEFRNIFKRCIYILLNNWIYGRKSSYAQNLIEHISHPLNNNSISNPILRKLRNWLVNFINSEDYREIKIFADKYENREQDNWKSRYTSYLLAPQYLNTKNSLEQRQAARRLSKQLQDRFKFDLAMYTAHSSPTALKEKKNQNPTALGEEALRLIKTVLVKRGFYSYTNLANIFLKQTQEINYKSFKQSLLKYQLFALEQNALLESVKTRLAQKLEITYSESNGQQLTDGLLLKTCNRMLEHLTIEKNGEPSPLFILIASQGSPLTLAILILKILLVSPKSRSYLEACMAKLIYYYESYSQEECHWVINFLEICKIILTIYADNVQYNLVNMENENLPSPIVDRDTYRIFSQSKQEV